MNEQLDVQKQATSTAGFIRAYGMYWKADGVDWYGSSTRPHKELLGRVGKQGMSSLKVTNFWEQRGIYILYNDYGPYYVGRTSGDGMNLGKRLSQHAIGPSPHVDRWDRFSWFGWHGTLASTDARGLQRLRAMPKRLLTDSYTTIGDIESMMIQALGTINRGNARVETFAAAAEWTQVPLYEREEFLGKAARYREARLRAR